MGIPQPHHEDDIQRDGSQSVRPNPSSQYIPRCYPRTVDLEVSCGSGGNKRRKTLTFEVVTFDIGYNCIQGRLFLLKFMAVIHTAYATMKMPGLNDIITIMANQQDTLACKNVSLSHVRCFGEKTVQDQMAKTQGGSPPHKTSVT
jgi:hypothetical protein